MKKIIDYDIVRVKSHGNYQEMLNELKKEVKAMNLKGWQPLGGVMYAAQEGVLQSIVMYEE